MTIQKKDLDVSRVFLAYLSLQGDVQRTAFACNIDAETVRDLAIQEQWAAKIQQSGILKEQDHNFQINLNRALSYVQARQLSGLIDEVIKKLSNPDDLADALVTVTKNGSSFSTKPLTDLVRAAEIVQNMAARALGDVGAASDDDKTSAGAIGLNVARALNAVAANVGVDAVTIVKKSLTAPNADDPRLPEPTPPAAT